MDSNIPWYEKKIAPENKNSKNNQANVQNPNKGTNGTNRQYDQNQGNRGKQLNPNQINLDEEMPDMPGITKRMWELFNADPTIALEHYPQLRCYIDEDMMYL